MKAAIVLLVLVSCDLGGTTEDGLGVGYVPIWGRAETCLEINHTWKMRVEECGGLWLDPTERNPECRRTLRATPLIESPARCLEDLRNSPCDRISQFPASCQALFR